jgi:putative addiction module CopG family antidote
MFADMATKTRNISLPPMLDAWAEQRARSGLYGNLSAVVQAGLRALQREEMGVAWREWQEAKTSLPQDAITPEIEERIAARVRALRRAEKRRAPR